MVHFRQFGGIIALVLCMLFVAKSERCKSLGKMAVAQALCGVSGPVVFGIPSRKRSTKKAFNRKSCVNVACNSEYQAGPGLIEWFHNGGSIDLGSRFMGRDIERGLKL